MQQQLRPVSSRRSNLRMASTAQEQDESSATTDDAYGENESIYSREAKELANLRSTFLTTMRDRGYLHQCTGLEALDEQLCLSNTSGVDEEGRPRFAAYLGFDATADSLHVGSLLQIMILRHLQKSGHKPIVLIGGATSKVGDPTGKDESRAMLNDETIQANVRGIRKVFAEFLTFSDDNDDPTTTDAVMVNNDDWLGSIKYLDFLRTYGTQFTINRMLSFESVKQRLNRESPFSFLEFNYMILQAYDFLELSRGPFQARLQLGGSDQWGNIVSGTELGRKCDNTRLFGLTAPLVTTSDGRKMGKTAGGAVWLNADKLSPYDYWQFWRNTSDEDVGRFLKLFTELPLTDVETLGQLEGKDINRAKIVLADEATALLHGADCLPAIQEAAEKLFASKRGGGGNTESLPRVYVTSQQMADGGVPYIDLLKQLGFAKSNSEGRRLITGGGVRINDVKMQDVQGNLTNDEFTDGQTEVTLRAGKKRAGVVEIQQ